MKFTVPITFDAPNEDEAGAVVRAMLAVLKDYGIKAQAGALIDAIAAQEGCIMVYTDGGCDLGKDGIGAWAYVIEKDKPGGVFSAEESGCFIGTTNNRMEMMAVIVALENIEIGVPIKVVSDSEYVIKGVTMWSRNWIRNGWRTRDGKPVVNKDLWERLIALYQLHQVTFEHVKGHTGHPQNERCDQLCTAEMVQGHKAALAGDPPPVDDGCLQRAAPQPQVKMSDKGLVDEL